jgi:hypothetical protein
MTQTFDIRFARSAGLVALLEVPENAFRWKGGGRLRIDAQGISISVKRGLLALLGGKHTQRIPTEDLRAVYREGDALRVEFQSGADTRVVMPFWADDRDTAAKIVQLLPTRETVELEHSTDVTRSTKSRADWRAIGIAVAAVVAMGVSSLLIYRSLELPAAPVVATTPASSPATATANQGETTMPPGMPDATRALDDSRLPAVEVPSAAAAAAAASAAPDSRSEPPDVPGFLEPPPFDVAPPGSLPLPRDFVRYAELIKPLASGTAAYDVAKRELALFEREAAGLERAYRTQRDLLVGNALTPEDFATELGKIEMRWWNLTFRVFDNVDLMDPALIDFRASLLGAARRWRGFLNTYADGLRERDHLKIASAFDELALAQEMQSRARLYVR